MFYEHYYGRPFNLLKSPDRFTHASAHATTQIKEHKTKIF